MRRRDGLRLPGLAAILVIAAASVLLARQAPPKPQTPTAKPPPKAGAVRETITATAPIARSWTGDIDGMIKRRVIRVATTYNRTHYFIDRGVQRGAVYEAFKLFEDELSPAHKTPQAAGARRPHPAGEPMDRLNKGLFALASYNAGPARVRQLRREAEKRGLDPNVWFNNVERIASERIGRETVQYVANIYKYYIAYRLVLEEREERGRDKGAGPGGRN
jgi:hypothetical protein